MYCANTRWIADPATWLIPVSLCCVRAAMRSFGALLCQPFQAR